LLNLPYDILIQILAYFRPSAVFRLARTCRSLHSFLLVQHPSRIAQAIVSWRYPILAKCMRLPVLLNNHDASRDLHNNDTHALSLRDALLDQERLRGHDIRRRPYYQHLTPPDPHLICTCLTCVLRWHVLCLAVDFAHWQDRLDAGEPLPAIARGERPAWNARLLEAHAGVVLKAVLNPTAALWHASILQAHLASTVRAIQRHAANRFNHRPRFQLTARDAAAGTDAFLALEGPSSMDMPFHRDNYYMLEAYLPNRSWFAEDKRWGYLPAEQHQRDLEQLRK
ncbi:hypothetical protein BD289DRAFT_354403, partial [Coniella lustricola]